MATKSRKTEKAEAKPKKEPKPRIPTSSHPYKRTGAHRQAPANGNSRLARTFIQTSTSTSAS